MPDIVTKLEQLTDEELRKVSNLINKFAKRRHKDEDGVDAKDSEPEIEREDVGRVRPRAKSTRTVTAKINSRGRATPNVAPLRAGGGRREPKNQPPSKKNFRRGHGHSKNFG